ARTCAENAGPRRADLRALRVGKEGFAPDIPTAMPTWPTGVRVGAGGRGPGAGLPGRRTAQNSHPRVAPVPQAHPVDRLERKWLQRAGPMRLRVPIPDPGPSGEGERQPIRSQFPPRRLIRDYATERLSFCNRG